MNKRFVLALLILGLGVASSAAWAQTAGFILTADAFRRGGVGSDSLGLTANDQASPLLPVELELVGHLGDDNRGLHIVGNYAYTTFGCEMAVLDISDPTRPRRVGYLLLPFAGRDVYVSGDYAYVSVESVLGGLRVIDVADPNRPVEVASLDVGGWGKIFVAGDYAYVVNGAGLQVIDVSDPVHPQPRGSVGASASGDVYVSGGYAHVGGGGIATGLFIIDVSDPDNPQQVGTCATPEAAWGVHVVGDYAYVADYGSGPYGSHSRLRVIDVADPTNPYQVGVEEVFLGAAGEAFGVYVAGDYAYVAGAAYIGPSDYGGVEVVDISDPTQPHSVGGFVTPEVRVTRDVYLSGDYAFLSGGNNGLRVVDVSDPANLTEVGTFEVVGMLSSDIQVSDDQAYAYLAELGLRTVNVGWRNTAPKPLLFFVDEVVAVCSMILLLSSLTFASSLYPKYSSLSRFHPSWRVMYRHRRMPLCPLDEDFLWAFYWKVWGIPGGSSKRHHKKRRVQRNP